MPNVLFIILLAYTAVWLSVNVYNLYPLLNYYRRRRHMGGGKYIQSAAQASENINTPASLP